MDETLDGVYTCIVCLEDYSESDDSLPRIFPCSHSACTKCCLDILGDRNFLVCPECRKKHCAESGVTSFPQNKYILASLKTKNQEKEQRRKLKDKLSEVKADIQERKNFFQEVKTKNAEQVGVCLDKIEYKKQRIIKILDDMKEKVEAQHLEVEKDIEDELAEVQEDSAALEKVQNETTNNNLTIFGLVDGYKIISGLEEKNSKMKVEMKEKKFQWFRFVEGDEKDEINACGKLAPVELSFEESAAKKEEPQKQDETVKVEVETVQLDPIDPDDVWFVKRDSTERAELFLVLSDTTIIVCVCVTAHKVNALRLRRYDVNGKCLASVKLQSHPVRYDDYKPVGMTEVEMGDRLTVAISRRRNRKIEFRLVYNLEKLAYTLSVYPRVPAYLCTTPDLSILYVNINHYSDTSDDSANSDFEEKDIAPTRQGAVYVVDCSGCYPKQEGALPFRINLKEENVRDVCVVRHDDEEYLVVACGNLLTFSLETGERCWNVNCVGGTRFNAISVTTDGRGHLYVSDEVHAAVQMFHVADGRYLGRLMKCDSDVPGWVRWCKQTSSLVVTREKNDKVQVLIVKI